MGKPFEMRKSKKWKDEQFVENVPPTAVKLGGAEWSI